MAVKAKLKIILKANDVIVAESDEPTLWQEVFSAINTNAKIANTTPVTNTQTHINSKLKLGNEVDRFAAELGVSAELLISACSPIKEAPYIHLDKHHWEALKKNTPERGNKAINAIILASTLLGLWKDIAKLGNVTTNEITPVLDTIGLNAKNATRSINNCEWLQLRNGSIIINPAQTSKAIKIANSYCNKVSPWE